MNQSSLKALAIVLAFSTINPAGALAQDKPANLQDLKKYDSKTATKYWKLGKDFELRGFTEQAIQNYAQAGLRTLQGGKSNPQAVSLADSLISKFQSLEASAFMKGDSRVATMASKEKLKMIEFVDGKESQRYKDCLKTQGLYEQTKKQ
ncbi:MAG: hypothetical protein KIT34_06145 [Cyanobacteria bacterium TGS_CYA1]|nr:hypothetical protein [Cyanobacteria bacterium TGS_CYA1]